MMDVSAQMGLMKTQAIALTPLENIDGEKAQKMEDVGGYDLMKQKTH